MKPSYLACKLIFASLMFSATPALWAQTTQKPVTMKIGHVLSESDNVHQALIRFKEAVAKRTNGTVTVAVYPGSSLGTLRQMFESIGLGTQEAGIFDAGTVANAEPAIGILELPYIFEDLEHVHRVVDGPTGKEIFDRTRVKTGMRTIVSYDTTFRKTFSKRPINSLADFKGLKVRVPEVPSYIETFKLLGANPTPIPWGELYTSLSSGVVDGFENKAEAALASRLHEQAKFAAYTGHIFVVNLMLVNDRWFSSLTPEAQKAIVESAKETEQWQRARAKQSEVEAEEKMKTAGIQFTRPDTTVLRNAVAAIYTTYGSKHNVSGLVTKVRNDR